MSANVSYVGKPCPKCRHVRTAADGGPDWQCPKCGIAYAKFGQPAPAAAPAPSQAGRSVTQQVSAGRTLAGAGGGGSTGLAMFVHLSLVIGIIIPFFGLIVPIVVWITKKDSDQLATANAKEAINFQITMILWVLVLIGLIIFAPIFGLALAVVLGLVALIMPIVAAVKANGGDEYRYPVTLHIFS